MRLLVSALFLFGALLVVAQDAAQQMIMQQQ